MRRLAILTLALLYLLPQAGIWAHTEAEPIACGDCDPASAGPRLECGDEDCGDPDHHHHSAHHHPGSCRICSSSLVAVLDTVSIDDVSVASVCPFIDPIHPAARPADPGRAIRAPPGNAPFPG